MSDTKRFPKWWRNYRKTKFISSKEVSSKERIRLLIISSWWYRRYRPNLEREVAKAFADKQSHNQWARKRDVRNFRVRENNKLRYYLANNLENYEPGRYKREWLD